MASQPSPTVHDQEYLYSPAQTVVVSAQFGLGSNLTWDAYARELYVRADSRLQQQANALLQRGSITESEVRALSAQRDLIRTAIRSRLSPFGRLYSEILAPSLKTQTFESRFLQKGSLEGVLESVGKSRAVVNRLATRMRFVGRAAVVVQIVFSAVVIIEAKPEDRARVATRQGGAIGGGVAGGWVGAWAGCAGAAALASPSLVIPWVGEVTEAGACLVGGFAGGLGLGALGAAGGERAAGAVYDYVTTLRWTRQ